MPVVKPRTAWTSSTPGGEPYDPHNYRGIAIHWPASAGSYAGVTDAQAAATLNGWRQWHMEGHGWSDIAYQYAVTDDGTVWTCRGIGRKSAANGDTGPNNAYGAVILFLGPHDPVTPAMRDAVRWLDAQYRTEGTGPEVVTHNEARLLFGLPGTDCPGPAATAAVERGHFHAADPAQPPAPPAPPEEDEHMARELAVVDDPSRALYSVNWLTLQHEPHTQWRTILHRLGLATVEGATTVNLVEFEWAMKSVLEAGGSVGCPAGCGVCLLETRYKAWADASNDRAAIAHLTDLLTEGE